MTKIDPAENSHQKVQANKSATVNCFEEEFSICKLDIQILMKGGNIPVTEADHISIDNRYGGKTADYIMMIIQRTPSAVTLAQIAEKKQ